jgi:hypothetical protein
LDEYSTFELFVADAALGPFEAIFGCEERTVPARPRRARRAFMRSVLVGIASALVASIARVRSEENMAGDGVKEVSASRG